MAWQNNIETSKPPDTGEKPSLGAMRIRNLKKAICERLVDLIYGFKADDTESDETKKGFWKLLLNKLITSPTHETDKGILFTKEVDGKVEVFYKDSTGTEKQITTGGKLNISDDSLAVLLTGDQTIGGIKTFSSIPVLPASDPTTDNQASRRKFITDKFDTTTGHNHDGTNSRKMSGNQLGAWESKSAGTVYQAATDGFVMCHILATLSSDSEEWVSGYTDANSSPTTRRAGCATGRVSNYDGYIRQNSFLMPVKKGDYWKVVSEGNNTPTITIYWIPLGG
ncbi:MAG TPA: hypothetical protein ENN27_03170 [Candidatus Atribacteria bacterium]|nr:hypothetical protein [Candidatus Atribacteria bacterium]